MQQGLADLRATGAGLWQTSFLALVAEAQGKAGLLEQGLGTLVEALAIVEKHDERAHEAELHRLQGELLLASEPADEQKAEASLQTALRVSHRQGALSFELRAATSLARVLESRGRHAEARHLLAPVRGRFTEGFARRDLVEADELLGRLDSSAPCDLETALGGPQATRGRQAGPVGSTCL
jgi:predicted ATPase